MRLTFITGNKHKLKEAKEILIDFDIHNDDLNIIEIQGEIHDVVKDKAKKAAELTNEPCFVDDTSLCFNALNGLPGQYVKDFVSKISREGLVNLLSAYEDKSAKAIAMIGYCEPGKEPVIIEGVTEGEIVKPNGESGFGWDPIFKPKGCDKTYAEMTAEEKNSVSHRRKSLEKLKTYLGDTRNLKISGTSSGGK